MSCVSSIQTKTTCNTNRSITSSKHLSVKALISHTPIESDSTVQYSVNVSDATMLQSHYGINYLELTYAMFETGLKETEFASPKHVTGSYLGAMSIQSDPDLYFLLSPRQKERQRLNMYRSCDKKLVAKNSSQYPDEVAGTAIAKCMMC